MGLRFLMSVRYPLLTALVLGSILSGSSRSQAGSEPSRTIEFNRDVRPILSDACFQCHGPDKAKRKANLRLDQEIEARADPDGSPAIVPGKPAQSELIRRIESDDESERMPPTKSGRGLAPQEIETLRRWIEQGATWQKHWSLITPLRPDLPVVADRDWARNPIDRFVLANLEREKLTPSPEADRPTLIRRLTFDLTGLPPTPDEVDSFLRDKSPGAYEKVVDRLLHSPRYGERMASRWLDAARFADTNGYQTDGEREMWRWRDWVIEAFNGNMPFDRFTIEQLAGDLLPGATLSQQIATGFNRNHRGNAEGGIIPEEYAVEYVVDRVDTTSTVWLGMTMLCARCHDHKYDPITQKEFYQVYAFFNNVPEKGKAIKFGNSPPVVKSPTRDQQARLADLERRLAQAESDVDRMAPALKTAQQSWERTVPSETSLAWSPTKGMIAQFPLDGNLQDLVDGKTSGQVKDGEITFSPGPQSRAAQFNGQAYVDAGDIADFGFYDRFSVAAWIAPENERLTTLVSRMADVDKGEGYSIVLEEGKIQVNLVKRWLDDALRVRTRRLVPTGEWHHVLVTYDGTRVAAGVKVYVDGRPAALDVLLDDLNQTFRTKQPFRIAAGNGPQGRFAGMIDDVRIYGRDLSANEAEWLASTDPIERIAAIAPEHRTGPQARKLKAYFLDTEAPQPIRDANKKVDELRTERDRLIETFPTTMVMREMDPPRPTFLLKRGDYDKPAERVDPGVPSCLPPLPSGVRADRLAFARWLVAPSNPLTTRVAVNRYWQMYFGTGLVKTVDDLGAQGERPRQAELLDWLASEFRRTGWDVKRMQETIVTSATYRQSSRLTPALRLKDPENRLLARGPRVRLSAEMIRDQSLAISGLLVEKIGGPSVRPYQPPGLWKELTDADYTQDHGANLYRRSLYTFWKRTISPPSMMTFDASARETCSVRETRTNTPLQALTLMNEVTFVEAARVLAERVLTGAEAKAEDRLTLAFRLATSRSPTASELSVLLDGLKTHRADFRSHPEAATRLVGAGEFPRNPALDPCELAAYTAIANLILNLDETINKE